MIFQNEHLLDWSNLGLLDDQSIFYVEIHVKTRVENMIHQAFEEGLFVDLSIIIVLHCIISFLFEFGGETYYSKIKLSQFHQQFKRNGKYIALNVKFQSWKTEIV